MCSDGTDTSAAAESALYKEAADGEQKRAGEQVQLYRKSR